MKVSRYLLHTDEINILWGLGIEGKAELSPRPALWGDQNESPAQEHGHRNPFAPLHER